MARRISFLKYNIYNNFIKKGRKIYFLLDFFKGLKGSFIYKNFKKDYVKYESLLYKSFSNLNSFNNKKKFDYFLGDFDINNQVLFSLFKKNKIKDNIFFVSLVSKNFFYSIFLRNI